MHWPLDQRPLAMTHRALGGLTYTFPTKGAPRVSFGHVPSPMGQEWFRLLELLAGPASHIHRHRKGVTSRPDADGADYSLLRGMTSSILVAGPLPHSMTVQADKMRLLASLAPVHLLEHSFTLPAYRALFGIGAYSPVPVLHSDHDTSEGGRSERQNVSHYN